MSDDMRRLLDGHIKASTLAAILVGLLLAVSGVSKLFSSQSVYSAILFLIGKGWPEESYRAVLCVAIGAETTVGLCLLAFPRSRSSLAAAITLLIALTAALVMLRIRGAPGCGCSVLIASQAGLKSVFPIALARNVALLCAVCFALADSAPAPQATAPRRHAQHPAGFSLVELLVILTVIALLLAIALPALARARQAAADARRLSNARQLAVAVHAYAEDSRLSLPFLAEPGNPDSSPRIEGVVTPFSYFAGQSVWWPSLLRTTYLSQLAEEISVVNMAARRAELRLPPTATATLYQMVPCAFTAPRYWSDPLPSAVDASWFRSCRTNEISHPSQKVLIFFDARTPVRASWIIARCDASAGAVSDTSTYDRNVVERPLPFGFPFTATRDGMAGIDLP